ncbi:MAG: DnaT-like ssDNA-binding protein [Clostridia bacterium]|jgi:hypothetical protein
MAYDTLDNADTYFSTRLHVSSWTSATAADKTKALEEATRRIDRLRFRGNKVLDTQELEFPRYYGDEADGTEEIPDDIKIACFEIAFSLLDGHDPEQELQNLTVERRTFVQVTTVYRDNMILDHLASGIPSALAWSYLRPYLARTNSMTLYRKS